MGELINLNTKVPITDADIPAAIARDTETTAAITAHTAAADPHPSLWTRISNAFLSLTGGQVIQKNNPAMSVISYEASQNHLELRTTNGSNPILGFHRSGFTATALYHLGYGNNSLRIRNADGYDSALLHDSNHVNVPGMHSVRCTPFSTVVPALGVPITVSHAPIPAQKIVGITFHILEEFAPGGTFYIMRSANEDLNPGNQITVTNGVITISGATANYFVGCPIHFLVSHIP